MSIAHEKLYNSPYAGHTAGARSFTDRLQEVVQELVPHLSLRSVIDVGTGSGELLRHLRESQINCIGLDIHEDKAKGITKFDLTIHNDAATIQQVRQRLPYSVMPFLTTCFDVLEHIDRLTIAHAIWNLRSITSEYLFTSVSTRPSSLHNLYHATIIPKTAWLELFSAAGFELIESDLVDELHVPMEYPVSDVTWCMNQWRALDPYKDNRVVESHYLLLRKKPEADFGQFEAFANRLLGNQPQSVRLAADTYLTMFFGHYQEFLLMQPFFESLPTERYRVVLRSGVFNAIEDHRRKSILAYFKSRDIDVIEASSPADVTWEGSHRRHAMITAIDSTAVDSHLINSAFLVAAQSCGVPTFQLQHGIWPHAEFTKPLTVLADCLLTWSPDFERPFDLGNCHTAQVGCPRFDSYNDDRTATMVELFGEWASVYSHAVLFATNLHWPMHKLGNQVLPQLAKTALEMPDTLFVCKLHPTHDYAPTQFEGMPKNVIVIDEFVSLYANLGTPRLIKACDVAVCTLSTVALEAAIAGKPFLVLETENPNSYKGVETTEIASLTTALKRILDGATKPAESFLKYYYDAVPKSSSLQQVIDTIESFSVNSSDAKTASHIAIQAFSSEYLSERQQRIELQAENHRLTTELTTIQQQLQIANCQPSAITAASIDQCVEATERMVAELAEPAPAAIAPGICAQVSQKPRPSVYDKVVREKNRLVRQVKVKWDKLRGEHQVGANIGSEAPQAIEQTREAAQPVSQVVALPVVDPAVHEEASAIVALESPVQVASDLVPELGEITNRDQLPQLLDAMGLKGLGIELGVAGGAYSDTILKNGNLRLLFSVDRWSDHHNDAECNYAHSVLSKHGVRSSILRMTFEEAVLIFADGTFDFIYIDGYAHLGQDGIDTLESWWPKLKVGGIFGGHDYDPAWPATIAVVDEFVRRHNATPYKTNEDPNLEEHAYATWYVQKK